MNKINSPSSKNVLKPAPDSDTFLYLFFLSKWTLFVGKLLYYGLQLDVLREKPE